MPDETPSPASTAQDAAVTTLELAGAFIPGAGFLAVLGHALAINPALMPAIFSLLNGREMTPEEDAAWSAGIQKGMNASAAAQAVFDRLKAEGKIS